MAGIADPASINTMPSSHLRRERSKLNGSVYAQTGFDRYGPSLPFRASRFDFLPVR